MAQLFGEDTALRELLNFGLETGYLDGPPLEHGASRDRTAHEGDHEADGASKRTMVGDELQTVLFVAKDGRVVGSAEAPGALGHCVHHRLDGCRRARDDAEDFAGPVSRSSASANAARRRLFSSMS